MGTDKSRPLLRQRDHVADDEGAIGGAQVAEVGALAFPTVGQHDIGTVVLVGKDVVIAFEANRTEDLGGLLAPLCLAEAAILQHGLDGRAGTFDDVANPGLARFDQHGTLHGQGILVAHDAVAGIQRDKHEGRHQQGKQHQGQELALKPEGAPRAA